MRDTNAKIKYVPLVKIRAQIDAVLRAWGMPEDLAAMTADLMAETDALGVDSHGISMLPRYEEKIRAGGLRIDARARVLQENASTALLDGMGGLGYPVASQAMHMAVDRALDGGVGAVAVRNSHHFGAAGVYARIAVRRGTLGFVTSSANGVIMVPTRAAMPMLGTNPIAFGAPASRNEAFVLDMATTTVAANKVKIYDYLNKPLPAGWSVDGEGRTLTDSAQAMRYVQGDRKEGGLTPLGGTPEMSSYKGYGLAMMAQILGATLTGSRYAARPSQPYKKGDPEDIGHFFLALNPDAFRLNGSFEADLDHMIDALHDTPPADPAEPVLVAGEPEMAESRRRSKQGAPMSLELDRLLRGICDRCGAPYLLGE